MLPDDVSKKLSFSQPELFWAQLLSTENLWQKTSQSRLIQQLTLKGAYAARWVSHTSRVMKTEVCLIALKEHVRPWEGHVGQGAVREMGLGCKWNNQSAETWVTTRHCKLLIPTPATSLEFARQCLTSQNRVFQLMTLPGLRKALTTRELVRACPGEPVSAAHFLLSETVCDTWHQVIQESEDIWQASELKFHCQVRLFGCFHN